MDDPEEARTRAGYDAVADRYAAEIGDELAGKPVDRALLDCLAELARDDRAQPDERGEPGERGEPRAGATRPIADVGCGPGHLAAYLAGRGARVVGYDLSPGMVAVARRRYAQIPFQTGSLTALPVPDGSWAGAVCAYVLIHLDADRRRAAYRELARVIAPGGWLLAAFHVSAADVGPGGVRQVADWWGHEVDLDFHFLDPDEVADGLVTAGFEVRARTMREPWPDIEYPSRRAYLLARRIDVLR